LIFAQRAGSVGRALTWAFALSAVMAIPKRGDAQLSVDELEIMLRPDRSAQRVGAIRVTNHSEKPVQALMELQDWDRDSTGANRFHPLGTLARSCRDQLKVFPLAIRIEAGKTESVRVNFGGDPATSCWGIVFIQANEPPRTSATQSQITYVIRTGVKVYVEPNSAERVGDIEKVLLDSTKAALEVVFRNSGTAHLKPRGAVELRDENNNVVSKLDILEFPVAPEGVRRLVLPLPKLNPGRYVALALLDYAGAEIAAGQYEFEVR
jgi:P pilus assembly chaperone PapD